MKLTVKNVQEALAFKEQLQAHGLLHDRDYTWTYTPKVEDWVNGTLTQATVEFCFNDAALGTYFRLKWVQI